MSRVFWLVVAGLLAVASHITYVLFAPPLLFQRALAAQTREAHDNEAFVLSPEAQARLFPAYPASSVVVMCKFNVGDGPVALTARMPFGYWTLSGYGADGKQFYSLTDEQAGTSTITVRFAPQPSLVDQIMGTGAEGTTVTEAGWQVLTPQKHGLAVLWAPVADPLLRPAVAKAMGASQCGPAGAG